ncbi:MAG: diacylglycerol kinase family protein [Bacteroidales bacterium]|nr:diacylglycerol kinase family protein [Bacteroidales bacterium]
MNEFRARLRSFRYAFAGMRLLFGEEHNARIHATITVLVVVAGIVLRVSPVEWGVLVICIGMVLAAEAFNSAIERIANYLTTERDDRIRDIKDLAAGAVLLCAIAAAIVGLIVFVPHIVYCYV